MGLANIALANENQEVWQKSYVLESKGEYEKAAAVLTPLLNNKTSEYVLLRYGWLNYLQGNYNDAIDSYKRALNFNSRSFDARLGISLPLMAQGRWKEASRYLKQVIAQSPYHYLAHVRLMICEEGLHQWKTLEKHSKSMAAYYPVDAIILVYLARSYAWQDKEEQAKAIYQRVLKRFPNHIEANYFLKGQQN
ncbi:MAG TPA: tetratricopeptide repeat protein [Mariprofundaceae bacterium]|nr:tetratricopeptide repeat protein [Mariprofundaceae bacterium]